MKNKNLFKTFFFFLILFLSLLRIDYRDTTPEIYEGGDDANYYFHNKTITYDFDLVYENQTTTKVAKFQNPKTEKLVPVHPIGSSFLSSIFMFLGRFIENIFSAQDFHYFLYSFSSIFYLFCSYKLLNLTINDNLDIFNKRKILNIFIFFGSGIVYYAFERFALTHVYEIFSVSLLIYLTNKYNHTEKKGSILSFLIGFLSTFLLIIRNVNYFLLLTPLFLLLLIDNRSAIRSLYREINYYVGLVIGFLTVFIITNELYGIATIFAGDIYNPSGSTLKNFINTFIINKNPLELFAFFLKSFYKIIFGFEFGLFFTTPIICAALISILHIFKNKNFYLLLISFITFSIPFLIVILWQTTASSFGFRYVLVLIPYAFLLVNKYIKEGVLENLLIILSSFSFVLYLFFETTEMTSLAENINMFGVLHKYSAPNYIPEVIKSMFILDSYLKIIFTSYIGVIILKLGFLLFGYEYIYNLIFNFGYLNEDVQNLINYSNSISILHIAAIFIITIICFNFVKKD
jgi:hypothetical protein